MTQSIIGRTPETAQHEGITKWGLVIAALLLMALWLLPLPAIDLGLANYLPIHTVLEIFAVAIAAIIFSTGWHSHLAKETGALSLLASGFLAVALLDTAHLLSFAGMPDWITPSSTDKTIEFWFAARYAAAVTLLILIMKWGQQITPRAALAISLAYLAIIFWLVLGHSDWLPVFHVAGKGLAPIKIVMEWGLVIINLTTLALLYRHKKQQPHLNISNLVAALILTILSELCFTLYTSVAEITNFLGHIYKVLSYIFLYRAVVAGSIKRPHKLLTENQEILQQLTDNIRHVFWMALPDFKENLFISPTYKTVWGRSCQSLRDDPNSWSDAIHPADRQRVFDTVARQTIEPQSMEFRIIRPDGSERWVRNQSFPIRDASGMVIRIAGIAEDVTEQVRAAATLTANESRLRAILKTATDGIHIVDANGTLIEANDAFLRAIGCDESCLGGLKIWDWDAHSSREFIEAGIKKLIASGEAMTFETRFRHRDGHEFWAEVSVRGFQIAGENLIYASSREISERKQAEAEREQLQAQLLQAQKMESIGQLTGGIAHDFNNMLAAILGYAELINRLTPETAQCAERAQKYSNAILTAGNRAKELIAKMLIFSRLSPETKAADAPVILLQPVITEILQLLRSSIPSTIELESHIDETALRARIQPVHLHQILLNLVINARDAIGEYGRIDVTLTQRTLTSTTCNACHSQFSGDYVELAISDTGTGISDQLLSKIFEPFFTTKAVGKGTGMGLSVVHGLVHGLGGHITATSVAGRGTTLHILLPAVAATADETGQSTRLTTPNRETLRGLRIMVVDDEQSITTMLHEFLSMDGAAVTTYNRPTAALAAFEKEPHSIDMIITDQAMPDLSGFDMARDMLKIRPDLPILLCTGYSEHVNTEIARANGIAGFMNKPIDISKLLEWIQHQHPTQIPT